MNKNKKELNLLLILSLHYVYPFFLFFTLMIKTKFRKEYHWLIITYKMTKAIFITIYRYSNAKYGCPDIFGLGDRIYNTPESEKS